LCLGCSGPQFSYLCLHVAGKIGWHHKQLFIGQEQFSLTFCLGWPWTTILPTSASWVAGITDVSHLAQLSTWLLLLKYSPAVIFTFPRSRTLF
jgi:hypothetical protein